MRGQALLAAGALAITALISAANPAQAQSYGGGPYAAPAPYGQPAQTCLNRKKSNAVLGALLGAGVGAMLGNNIAGSGHRGDGSVLGGVVGAGAGAAIGGSGAPCVNQPGYGYAPQPAPPPVAAAPAPRPYGDNRYGDDDELAGGPDYDRGPPPPRAYAYDPPPRRQACRWGEAVQRDRWGRPYRTDVYMCRDPYSGEWVIRR